MPVRTFSLPLSLLCFLLAYSPTFADNNTVVEDIPQPHIFDGNSGQSYSWEQLFSALDSADVIILGETHADAKGHVVQREIIVEAARRWHGLTVSLEEFDRSQQPILNTYERNAMTGAELKATRSFVDPAVKQHWMEWNLPKLKAAREGGASLLASNAPLKYSRLVRNVGCDNLPEVEEHERPLFECPKAAEDPAYKARFVKRMTSVAARNKNAGMKPLQAKQTDRMFRAQRVWDATMAQSIVQARADGADKVLHIVGGFHSDFNGGLIQELRYRDPDSRILVICLATKSRDQLADSDRGRADIIIYPRG